MKQTRNPPNVDYTLGLYTSTMRAVHDKRSTTLETG